VSGFLDLATFILIEKEMKRTMIVTTLHLGHFKEMLPKQICARLAVGNWTITQGSHKREQRNAVFEALADEARWEM